MTAVPNERRWRLGLLLGSALMCAWLVARSWGMYPVVFADEWIYDNFSRLSPLKTATVPSWLYLSAFRATNACGDRFLDCVRVFNCLWFAAATPFYYLTARRFAGPAIALAVALTALLLPVSSYTAYFMPESMYFFGFAVLTWVALAHRDWHWARLAIVSGVILGLMTLVKVHALFLIPSLCLYNAYASGSLRRAPGAMALTVAAVFAVKFGVGYALAGPAGLQLVGSLYGGTASGGLGAGARLLMLAQAALVNGRGHLLGLVVVFALPIAVVVHALLSPAARLRNDDGKTALSLYTVLMLGAALAMTVLYTAGISDSGPGEGLRLHVRYYSFAFPLLLLVAGAALADRRGARRGVPAWIVAALLAVALLAAFDQLPGYRHSMIDGPDFAGMSQPTDAGKLMISLDLLLLLLWLAGQRAAAALFLFLVMPLWILDFNLSLTTYWKQVRKPQGFDMAGTLVHNYIKPSERKDVLVAGTNFGQLMRAQFQIDDPGVGLLDLPDGAPFEMSMRPGNRKWLLVVGKHALPPGLEPPVVVMPREFVLIKLDNTHRKIAAVKLSGPLDTSVITSIDGLSYQEAWGRWSSGKLVTVHFAQPLPKKLNFVVTGQAFGPNIGQDFKVRAGDAEAGLRLGATTQDALVRLRTDGKQRSVTIEVPQPVAPRALDPKSVDLRTVGLGLIGIEIGTTID